MTRKIIKIGSSYGSIIPKDMLDKLGWSAGEPIGVYLNEKDEEIRIKRIKAISKRDKEITERTLDFITRYREDLEALRDK